MKNINDMFKKVYEKGLPIMEKVGHGQPSSGVIIGYDATFCNGKLIKKKKK